MTQHFGLILDSLIVVLLVATIVYAAILNRRLSQLRNNRKEMETAVRSFAEAAVKADAGIKGLKRTADETGSALQKNIERAHTLRDELAFLVDASETLARRLEGAASGAVHGGAHSGTHAGRGDAGTASRAAAAGDGRPPLRSANGRPGADEPARAKPSRQDLLKSIENIR